MLSEPHLSWQIKHPLRHPLLLLISLRVSVGDSYFWQTIYSAVSSFFPAQTLKLCAIFGGLEEIFKGRQMKNSYALANKSKLFSSSASLFLKHFSETWIRNICNTVCQLWCIDRYLFVQVHQSFTCNLMTWCSLIFKWLEKTTGYALQPHFCLPSVTQNWSHGAQNFMKFTRWPYIKEQSKHRYFL